MSSFALLIRLRPEVAALDWERIRGHILFKDLTMGGALFLPEWCGIIDTKT